MFKTDIRWPSIMVCALLAAGCGASAEDAIEEIGTITATVGGTDLVYSVVGADGDRRGGFDVRAAGAVETVSISSNRLEEGDVAGVEPASLSLVAQTGSYGMKSITLVDGQGFMNPLESTGMSGTAIDFTSRGESGIWAGTFSATLQRQSPERVDPGKSGTLEAPVSIEGFFSIQP